MSAPTIDVAGSSTVNVHERSTVIAGGAADVVTRNARLDVLRAAAVALVMGRHLYAPPAGTSGAIFEVVTLWGKVGWAGVDLFFVLSGFLVAGLLFREHQRYGDVQPGRFLIRRGFKIYPAFYAFLLLTFFVGVFKKHPTYGDLFTQFVFLQNYSGQGPGVWDHTWSLAVEEHFYILLAIVAAWRVSAARKPMTMKQATLTFAALATVVFLIRCVTTYAYIDDKWDKHLVLFPTHIRIDSLSFGVFLSYIFHCQKEVWARLSKMRVSLLLLSAVLLTPLFVFDLKHWFTSSIGYTLYYLGFGALLVAVLARDSVTGKRFSVTAIVAFIGANTYSIYLWHSAVNFWSHPIYQRLTGQEIRYSYYMAFYLTLSIVVGVVMARIIETPFLKLRDRLFPSRSAVVVSR